MRPCLCDNCPKTGEPWTGVGCYDCWRFYNVAKAHKEWGGTDPTLLEKINNFAGALVKHVASGFKKTSDEQFEQRINICKSCQFYVDRECKKCGCIAAIKARWFSQNCPIDLWPVLSDGKKCGCGS